MSCERAGVRVANFTDTYLPRRDGVITSIRTLAGALSESGHATLTVVPRHPDQPRDESLLRLRAVPCGVADLRLSPWLLRRAAADGTLAAVAAHAPDVIHVHTPGPVGLLGVLAARQLGLPLVQTYHTDLHAYAEAYRVPARALRVGVGLYARRLGLPRPPMCSDLGGLAVRPGRRSAALSHRFAAMDGMNVLLLGDADAVVVPTGAVLGRIRLPVPDERVFLVPTGVALRPSTAEAAARFRDCHRIAPSEPVVLFVGRINREKGIELLLDAFARVLTGCPRARLVLVGAMYEPKWFAALLRNTAPNLTERIVLTGQQPPDVVAAAYAAAGRVRLRVPYRHPGSGVAGGRARRGTGGARRPGATPMRPAGRRRRARRSNPGGVWRGGAAPATRPGRRAGPRRGPRPARPAGTRRRAMRQRCWTCTPRPSRSGPREWNRAS